MKRRTTSGLAKVLFLSLACVPSAEAGISLPTGFRDSLVVGGLNMSVAMAIVPDTSMAHTRVLIVEQKLRRLRLAVDDMLAPADAPGSIADVDWVAGERGVLSLAIDPRWPVEPFVYVHYTSTFSAIHLARYRMTGDIHFTGSGAMSLDPASRMLLIDDVTDINTNHNGGSLRFGPDGMLYLTLGDDQTACLAQDTTSLAGKLLRLDVMRLPPSGAGPAPRALITPVDNPHVASPDSNFRLVHAVGLRNPFRAHIDPVDGAIFIADVGQTRYEEIDRIEAPSNLGWPWYEAHVPYTTCIGPPPMGVVGPIATLQAPEHRSIISLGVYRAPAGATRAFPAEYDGDYFFSDYYSGSIRRIGWNGSAWVPKPAAGQPSLEGWGSGAVQVVDAQVARDGALLVLLQGVGFTFDSGELHRIGVVHSEDSSTSVPSRRESDVSLRTPQPNPSIQGDIDLEWSMALASEAELSIVDLAGRVVRVVSRGTFGAGTHRVRWDGRDSDGVPVAAGVYLARVRTPSETRVQRIARLH